MLVLWEEVLEPHPKVSRDCAIAPVLLEEVSEPHLYERRDRDIM